MNETSVAKQSKPEIARIPAFFGTPLFRENLFAVSPFTLMRQFTGEMDRIFGKGAGVWSPAVEVTEKDGKLLLSAELPGLKKEDVKVYFDGESIVVEGERKIEKEEKSEGFYHSERNYGKFFRSIPLPAGAKTEQATAHFNNGLLEVAVPVPEAKPNRKEIPIVDTGAKPKTDTARVV